MYIMCENGEKSRDEMYVFSKMSQQIKNRFVSEGKKSVRLGLKCDNQGWTVVGIVFYFISFDFTGWWDIQPDEQYLKYPQIVNLS